MKNRIPVAGLSMDEALVAAHDAYVYGFPLVLMDVTRQVMTAVASPDGRRAPANQFAHIRTFPDPSSKDVVSPNADTLCSAAWLDLAKEPMVLSVPAMNRYYLMQMLDAWTNVFSSAGTRTTGNDKADFAITGPSWRGKLPSGLKPIQSPTRFLLLAGRTQTNGKEDYPEVNTIQDQYKLTPLSAWGQAYTPPGGTPFNASINVTTPPLEQVLKMDASTFFSRLNALLMDNPPALADSISLGRFASINVAPGRRFDLSTLGPSIWDGVHKGVEAARTKIVTEGRRSQGRNVNGWDIMPDNIGSFGTDYDSRAYIAFFALGANLPKDAIYLRTTIDTQGTPLNGNTAYVIRFQKGQLPPVNAFWSVTAYTSTQYFIPNPIGRYAIGDRDNLKVDSDGSVGIHIGSVAGPSAHAESNWLPVGKEPFNLIMRLYWPKQEAINGTWRVPGVHRVRS